MAAKDIYHEIVKHALETDGWKITHDPYTLKGDIFQNAVQIDLGAEKLIGAEKENQKIAVEIKTFGGTSLIYDFHQAVGQILHYQIGLDLQEPERILILAIPSEAYSEMQTVPIYELSFQKHNIHVIVYDIDNQTIILWRK